MKFLASKLNRPRVNILGGSDFRKAAGLPRTLLDKFLFLWTGKYDGDDLLSDLDASVITVTGKNWITKTIPQDTEATFAVPDNATYLAADGTDDWWFNGAGVLQQKTHADLIISTTMRTFIKYNDFDPYYVSAIGILKDGEVITEADEIVLNRFFKLWVQYWGLEMMLSGYMKDNRTFIEDV